MATIDHQQRFGAPLNFDHMPYNTNTPQFTNPWTSSAPPQSHSLYAASHLESLKQQQQHQPPRMHATGSYAVPLPTSGEF